MTGALRRHPILAALAAAVVLAATGFVTVWAISRQHCFTLTGSIVCRVATNQPRVALSFDDGPTERGVAAVLPVLEDRGVRATFFLIGQEVAERPHLARRIAQAGHELGNHSWSHRLMIGRPGRFYDREIADTERAVAAAAGGSSGLFRAPYSKKFIGLPLAVERHGLRMISAEIADPETRDPAAFAREIVARARPGSIILVHPMYGGGETARTALPLILDGLKAKGLQVGTVGELLATAPSAGP